MKYLKTVLCASVLLATSVYAMPAKTSHIGILDVKSVFQDSKQIRRINANLDKQFAKQKQAVLLQGHKLQEEIKQYKKNKLTMNKAALKKTEEKIAQDSLKFHKSQSQYAQKRFMAQNKAMNQFMQEVRLAAAKVAKAKRLDFILPNNVMVYSRSDLDVTHAIEGRLK